MFEAKGGQEAAGEAEGGLKCGKRAREQELSAWLTGSFPSGLWSSWSLLECSPLLLVPGFNGPQVSA